MKIKLILIIISNIFMLSVAKIFAMIKLNKIADIILNQVEVNMNYVKGVMDNE